MPSRGHADPVSERVAIVTGASSGIGAATARLLGERGLVVAAVGRDHARLSAVVNEIEAAGGTAFPVPGDLGEPETPAAIVDAVLTRTDRIDAIVNCAAMFTPLPLGELTAEHVDVHFAVNVRAIILLVQAALPALRRSSSAVVVNVSSASAAFHRVGWTVYGMTKSAVEHVTVQLAVELAGDGIRVNAVRPGPTATPVHDIAGGQQRLDWLATQTLRGRVAQPQELAWWIAALIGQEGDWVTGAVVAVDGGRALGPPGMQT
jgi:NAD(P)-dependent dehydrogenase (short-subunit alcohol dehydrogenase family)